MATLKISSLLTATLCLCLSLAACHHAKGLDDLGEPVDGGDDAWPTYPDFGTDDGPPGIFGDLAGAFDVQPSTLQTITVGLNATSPTVAFTATLAGVPVNAAWTIDRGDVATLPANLGNAAQLTPKGTVGGMVTITAGFNGQTASRQVFVQLAGTQNGATTPEASQVAGTVGDLTAGGGIGGVGGEGLGGTVTDTTALTTPTGDAVGQALGFLYPYDKTVWPRGMLAPLVMWSWTTGDADAIQISLKTSSGSFSWTGTFARPAILGAGKFVRHPIPQDVWKMATETAIATDTLTVGLTVASGGVGYGPITQTWHVAPARLSGIIYYNSYGTTLAKNSSDTAVGGDGRFGGAVLSIHVGDTAPKLAAGFESIADESGCRVCHSVSANGSKLISQRRENGNYLTSSLYDITTTGLTESTLVHDATFSGLFPDGSKTLSATADLLPMDVDTTPIPTTGLSTVSTSLGTPAFSPDGQLLAFSPQDGGNGGGQKLYSMSYSDSMTNAICGGPIAVVDDTAAASSDVRPSWASFTPDSKSVVFHQQTQMGVDGNAAAGWTRKFAKAQIAWTSVDDATHVTVLNQLNGLDSTGTSYLPQLAAPSTLACTADGVNVGAGAEVETYDSGNHNSTPDLSHQDDVHLNYEPTVNPVASGGYAWVVFTSRRMYGNEATIPPFCSDPRGVDLVSNVTTKKLWVAAVDLNGTPGTDVSHPAFYLPAQELLAGNSRAFWVLDPCRADGATCETGDQCCNGYCEPNGTGGALVCNNTPPNGACSNVSDKCMTSADCCDPTNQCINNFCTVGSPQIL